MRRSNTGRLLRPTWEPKLKRNPLKRKMNKINWTHLLVFRKKTPKKGCITTWHTTYSPNAKNKQSNNRAQIAQSGAHKSGFDRKISI